MRPAQGDSVKFTDNFINNSPLSWAPALKDTELLVAKVKLATMFPNKIFTIFIMVNNMMYKVSVNETGHFVSGSGVVGNQIVFEPFHSGYDADEYLVDGLNSQTTGSSVPAWVPNAPGQHSKPATADEANATCLQCGAPAIDLIFSVKCTNPDCRNY